MSEKEWRPDWYGEQEDFETKKRRKRSKPLSECTRAEILKRECARRYNQKNKEKLREKGKVYFQRNKEYLNEYRKQKEFDLGLKALEED